jgi:hypothetical protein
MGVVRTGETDADKELQRWDTPKAQGGERCNGYEPFPKMVYQAQRLETGKVVCTELDPRSGAMYAGTTKIVKHELELRTALGQGWHEGPRAAMEAFEAQQRVIADEAAREAYRLQRMSGKAQAEHEVANADTMEHIVDPPAPRKRGRRTRITPADLVVE